MQSNKIMIAEGAGFIGQAVAECFDKNNQIVIISCCIQDGHNSNGQNAGFYTNSNVRLVCWNGKSDGDWMTEVDGADLAPRKRYHLF